MPETLLLKVSSLYQASQWRGLSNVSLGRLSLSNIDPKRSPCTQELHLYSLHRHAQLKALTLYDRSRRALPLTQGDTSHSALTLPAIEVKSRVRLDASNPLSDEDDALLLKRKEISNECDGSCVVNDAASEIATPIGKSRHVQYPTQARGKIPF